MRFPIHNSRWDKEKSKIFQIEQCLHFYRLFHFLLYPLIFFDTVDLTPSLFTLFFTPFSPFEKTVIRYFENFLLSHWKGSERKKGIESDERRDEKEGDDFTL